VTRVLCSAMPWRGSQRRLIGQRFSPGVAGPQCHCGANGAAYRRRALSVLGHTGSSAPGVLVTPALEQADGGVPGQATYLCGRTGLFAAKRSVNPGGVIGDVLASPCCPGAAAGLLSTICGLLQPLRGSAAAAWPCGARA